MKEAIRKLSEELGLPQEVVKKVYGAYWLFIKNTIEELPLKANLTKEGFNKLRTNFNLPFLGKLSCTYEKWLRVKKKSKHCLEKYGNKYKES